MAAIMFDTLKAAHHLQAVGMPRKQADAIAELMGDALSDRAGKENTAASLTLLSAKIDALDKRHGDILERHSDILERHSDILERHSDILERHSDILERHSDILESHSDTLAKHGEAIGRLESGQARIEALLAKLLDGQAVLHQNDMELKRRLDERG
jgi:hypothetical protein